MRACRLSAVSSTVRTVCTQRLTPARLAELEADWPPGRPLATASTLTKVGLLYDLCEWAIEDSTAVHDAMEAARLAFNRENPSAPWAEMSGLFPAPIRVGARQYWRFHGRLGGAPGEHADGWRA